MWSFHAVAVSDAEKVLRKLLYQTIFRTLLGAFAKLRKATFSLAMSVCLSAWNNSAPNRRIFMKFDSWVFFETVDKISFIKIWQEYRALYMKAYVHLWQHLAQFFLKWEMFPKIRPHILRSVTIFFFFKENQAVYGRMWKDILDPDMTRVTI